MTFRRVINRNGLTGKPTEIYGETGYSAKISLWDTDSIRKVYGYPNNDGSNIVGFTMKQLCDEIDKINQKWGLLMGDLRRLEMDAVDESAISKQIATRTGLDPEVIAIVLKEFMAW